MSESDDDDDSKPDDTAASDELPTFEDKESTDDDLFAADDTAEAFEVETEDEPEAVDEDYALGQSEIDDLFGIDMDEKDEPTGIEALISNATVRHKRLPTLEACIERLVRSLTNSMRKFTVGNIELSLADSTTIRFGNYIDSVPLPTLISIYKAVELGGYGLITIDSPLIYSIIDVLLGGSSASKSPAIEGRSFTKIEAMLIERMITLILSEMSTAFEPLSKVRFLHERLESTPNRAMIAHPSDKAVLFKIDVDMDTRGGSVEILIPHATLEPLSGVLQQMFKGEGSAQDKVWETHLAGETLVSDTHLEVLLGQNVVPLRTIMNLEIGTTLQLAGKPADPMILKCGDTPLMRGKVGKVGDTMAIMVDSWFSEAERMISRSRDAQEKGV